MKRLITAFILLSCLSAVGQTNVTRSVMTDTNKVLVAPNATSLFTSNGWSIFSFNLRTNTDAPGWLAALGAITTSEYATNLQGSWPWGRLSDVPNSVDGYGITNDLAALSHDHGWSAITNTPTTINGYGIVDYLTNLSGSLPWGSVSGTPTTLSGYEIVDYLTNLSGSLPWGSISDTPTTLTGYGITNEYAALSHDQDWSTVTNTPTTLSGYGITDAAESTHNQDWSTITNTPNSLAGYGITNSIAVGAHDQDWSTITNTPTTLGGYGITDAASSTHDQDWSTVTNTPTTLAGYGVTGSITNKVDVSDEGVSSFAGTVKIAGGSPGAGKVLTSSADGTGSWETASSVDTNLLLQVNGWNSDTNTYTYSSADAPTFVIYGTSASTITNRFSPGMRIKLTQNSTNHYYIVTAVSGTNITMYGGTDYVLANAAISQVYYSNVKAPVGFPLNPAKWTVKVTDTSDRTVTASATDAWTNINSTAISVPIGSWNIRCKGSIGTLQYGNDITLNIYTALSTASSSVSSTELVTYEYKRCPPTTGYHSLGYSFNMSGFVTTTTKTSYYLLVRGDCILSAVELTLENASQALVIEAICNYL